MFWILLIFFVKIAASIASINILLFIMYEFELNAHFCALYFCILTQVYVNEKCSEIKAD